MRFATPFAAAAVAADPIARLPGLLRAPARAVLRVGLARKLVGANALVAAAAVLAAVPAAAPAAIPWTVAALAAALGLSLALVALALRPLHQLERTAAQVWRGDVDARVPPSPLADPAVARVGFALNTMLDALARDRARLQALTDDAIRAGHGERDERLELERALRESAAQTLAAAVYQLSAARRQITELGDAVPADAASALALAYQLAGDALDEVRQLADGARSVPVLPFPRPTAPATPGGVS